MYKEINWYLDCRKQRIFAVLPHTKPLSHDRQKNQNVTSVLFYNCSNTQILHKKESKHIDSSQSCCLRKTELHHQCAQPLKSLILQIIITASICSVAVRFSQQVSMSLSFLFPNLASNQHVWNYLSFHTYELHYNVFLKGFMRQRKR